MTIKEVKEYLSKFDDSNNIKIQIMSSKKVLPLGISDIFIPTNSGQGTIFLSVCLKK